MSKYWRKDAKEMKLFVAFLFLFLVGCKDKFDEGYRAGYSNGVLVTEEKLQKEYDEKIKKLENSNREFSISSTSVCGGGGVTVGSKHYEGGKTGCVKVYSDGKVVRY